MHQKFAVSIFAGCWPIFSKSFFVFCSRSTLCPETHELCYGKICYGKLGPEILSAIVLQNPCVLVFRGYRTMIARYVTKRGIAQSVRCAHGYRTKLTLEKC